MNHQLTCPVCDRSAIEINICPNCQTDLSLIRMLTELPTIEAKIDPKVSSSAIDPQSFNWQRIGLVISILLNLGLILSSQIR